MTTSVMNYLGYFMELGANDPTPMDMVPENQAYKDYYNAFFDWPLDPQGRETNSVGKAWVDMLNNASFLSSVSKKTKEAQVALSQATAYRSNPANKPLFDQHPAFVQQLDKAARSIVSRGRVPGKLVRMSCVNVGCKTITLPSPPVKVIDISKEEEKFIKGITKEVQKDPKAYQRSRGESIKQVKADVKAGRLDTSKHKEVVIKVEKARGDLKVAEQEASRDKKSAEKEVQEKSEEKTNIEKEIAKLHAELAQESQKLNVERAQTMQAEQLAASAKPQVLNGLGGRPWVPVEMPSVDIGLAYIPGMSQTVRGVGLYAVPGPALHGSFSKSFKKAWRPIERWTSKQTRSIGRRIAKETKRIESRTRKQAFRISKRLAPFIGILKFLAPMLGWIPIIGQILSLVVLFLVAAVEVHLSYKNKQAVKKAMKKLKAKVAQFVAAVDREVIRLDNILDLLKAKLAQAREITRLEQVKRREIIERLFARSGTHRKIVFGLLTVSTGVTALALTGFVPRIIAYPAALALWGYTGYQAYRGPEGAVRDYYQCQKSYPEPQCREAWIRKNFGRSARQPLGISG